MKLSDWLIVVYVCMVLLLASMNGCVALCDLSKRLWIDVDWFFILPMLPSSSFLFHFIHCFLILIFDHGMASTCMNSDKVNCCMCCFIYCFVINSLTPLCFHFRIPFFVCFIPSFKKNLDRIGPWLWFQWTMFRIASQSSMPLLLLSRTVIQAVSLYCELWFSLLGFYF